jgi:hypothetical protein
MFRVNRKSEFLVEKFGLYVVISSYMNEVNRTLRKQGIQGAKFRTVPEHPVNPTAIGEIEEEKPAVRTHLRPVIEHLGDNAWEKGHGSAT